MNAWETLVASALVGTNRQEPSIDLTHPALADYEATLPSQSPIQQILSAAGLIAAYQAVGNSPIPTTVPLLPPAAEADLPCSTQLTARHLSAILNESRYEPLLPEFLQLLAQAGQTIPPDFLPLILDRGKRDRKLRDLILSILGNRGQWLVRQNPDWEYALGGALAKPIGTIIASLDLAQLVEIWATGTRSERLAALTQWRQIQPAEARQAVATSWKQDKADDRQAWLEVLQTNLSLDDEEFLEVALFDRSEQVRLQSLDLLNRLPSQYRQRLTKLASQCLSIEEKGKSCKIKLDLPKVGDKEWQAAGVNDKSVGITNIRNLDLTLEEWQVLQVLIAADLDSWSGDFDRLLDAAVRHERSLLILTGWVKAACYQQRRDWIEALLDRSYSSLEDYHVRLLLQSLPDNAQEFRSQFFTKLLTAENFGDNIHRTLQGMIEFSDNWSAQISSLVMQQFHKYIQQLDPEKAYYYYEQNHSNMLGQYLDVSVLPDLQQMQTGLPVDRFSYTLCIELLEFRRDMRSAFNTA
ncbi:DUF5691 domain-containing protein [Chamaesiphon sp. VAR_69_metabat_338]|uniref:DUF5691 domain-containing protein n=1 Tax=Chamaesiphon sp. VAR_69_metabat_338 TaxID=2964704 RepID=UPI00286DD38B|nr:DUF5691 domain-containing protein [Chamaesiphon sp. VAR_69_metabat_338]